MDLPSILAELKDAQEEFKQSDRSVATALFCQRVDKALDRVVREAENAEYDHLVVGILIVIGSFNDLLPQLQDGLLLSQLLDRLFRQCARVVLDIKWQQCDKDSPSQQNFRTSLLTCHQLMAPRGFTRFSVLQTLMDNPWTHPVLSMVMGSEDDNEEGDGLAYIQAQDPEILKLRVELMQQENCDEFALNLCTWCLKHPALAQDFMLRKTQFVLLHHLSSIDRLQEECQEMGMDESVRLINSLLGKEEHKELCTMLAQTFLVQNWIKPSGNDTKKELLQLWIRLQYQADQDQDRFITSLWAVAKVSHSTEQLLLIIDAVREQCGDTFLQFCLDLCVFAINVDKGCWEKLKESYTSGPNEEILARKRDMAQVCEKISHIMAHVSPKVSFCCALTAFSMLPTEQSLQAMCAAHQRRNQAVTSGKSQCCSNCAADKGDCLNSGGSDKTNRNVNVATLYEVERLCGMLRPPYLSSESEFSVLYSLCKQYLMKENGEAVKSALVRRRSVPSTQQASPLVSSADGSFSRSAGSSSENPRPNILRSSAPVSKTVDSVSHVSSVASPQNVNVVARGGIHGSGMTPDLQQKVAQLPSSGISSKESPVTTGATTTAKSGTASDQTGKLSPGQLVLKQLSTDMVQTLLHLIESGQISAVHVNSVLTKSPSVSLQVLHDLISQAKQNNSSQKPASSQPSHQQGSQQQNVQVPGQVQHVHQQQVHLQQKQQQQQQIDRQQNKPQQVHLQQQIDRQQNKPQQIHLQQQIDRQQNKPQQIHLQQQIDRRQNKPQQIHLQQQIDQQQSKPQQIHLQQQIHQQQNKPQEVQLLRQVHQQQNKSQQVHLQQQQKVHQQQNKPQQVHLQQQQIHQQLNEPQQVHLQQQQQQIHQQNKPKQVHLQQVQQQQNKAQQILLQQQQQQVQQQQKKAQQILLQQQQQQVQQQQKKAQQILLQQQVQQQQHKLHQVHLQQVQQQQSKPQVQQPVQLQEAVYKQQHKPFQPRSEEPQVLQSTNLPTARILMQNPTGLQQQTPQVGISQQATLQHSRQDSALSAQPQPVHPGPQDRPKPSAPTQQTRVLQAVPQIGSVTLPALQLTSMGEIQVTQPVHVMTFRQTPTVQSTTTGVQNAQLVMQTSSHMLTHLSGGTVMSTQQQPHLVRLPSASVAFTNPTPKSGPKTPRLIPKAPGPSTVVQGMTLSNSKTSSQSPASSSDLAMGNRHYSINNLLFTGEQQNSALSISLPDRLPEISVDSISDTLRALSDSSSVSGHLMPRVSVLPAQSHVSQPRPITAAPTFSSQMAVKQSVPKAPRQQPKSSTKKSAPKMSASRVSVSSPTAVSSSQDTHSLMATLASFSVPAQSIQSYEQPLPSFSSLFSSSRPPLSAPVLDAKAVTSTSTIPLSTTPSVPQVESTKKKGTRQNKGQKKGAGGESGGNKSVKKGKADVAADKEEMMRLLKQAMSISIQRKEQGKGNAVATLQPPSQQTIPHQQASSGVSIVPTRPVSSASAWMVDFPPQNPPLSSAMPQFQQSSQPGLISFSAVPSSQPSKVVPQHSKSLAQHSTPDCALTGPSISLSGTIAPAPALASSVRSNIVPHLVAPLTSIGSRPQAHVVMPEAGNSKLLNILIKEEKGHTVSSSAESLAANPVSVASYPAAVSTKEAGAGLTDTFTAGSGPAVNVFGHSSVHGHTRSNASCNITENTAVSGSSWNRSLNYSTGSQAVNGSHKHPAVSYSSATTADSHATWNPVVSYSAVKAAVTNAVGSPALSSIPPVASGVGSPAVGASVSNLAGCDASRYPATSAVNYDTGNLPLGMVATSFAQDSAVAPSLISKEEPVDSASIASAQSHLLLQNMTVSEPSVSSSVRHPPQGDTTQTKEKGDKPLATYRCIICSKAFVNLESLRLHVKRNCKPCSDKQAAEDIDDPAGNVLPPVGGQETSTVFQCMRCLELCVSEAGIRAHKAVCPNLPKSPSKPKPKTKSRAKPKQPKSEAEQATEARVMELLNKCLGENREKLLEEAEAQKVKKEQGKKKPARKRKASDGELPPSSGTSKPKKPRKETATQPAQEDKPADVSPPVSAVSENHLTGLEANSLDGGASGGSPTLQFLPLPTNTPVPGDSQTKEEKPKPKRKSYPKKKKVVEGTVGREPLPGPSTAMKKEPSTEGKAAKTKKLDDNGCKRPKPNASDSCGSTQPKPNNGEQPKPDTSDSSGCKQTKPKKPPKEPGPPRPRYRTLSGSGGRSFFKCLNCGQTLCSIENFGDHWLECIKKKPLPVKPKRATSKKPSVNSSSASKTNKITFSSTESIDAIIQSVASGWCNPAVSEHEYQENRDVISPMPVTSRQYPITENLQKNRFIEISAAETAVLLSQEHSKHSDRKALSVFETESDHAAIGDQAETGTRERISLVSDTAQCVSVPKTVCEMLSSEVTDLYTPHSDSMAGSDNMLGPQISHFEDVCSQIFKSHDVLAASQCPVTLFGAVSDSQSSQSDAVLPVSQTGQSSALPSSQLASTHLDAVVRKMTAESLVSQAGQFDILCQTVTSNPLALSTNQSDAVRQERFESKKMMELREKDTSAGTYNESRETEFKKSDVETSGITDMETNNFSVRLPPSVPTKSETKSRSRPVKKVNGPRQRSHSAVKTTDESTANCKSSSAPEVTAENARKSTKPCKSKNAQKLKTKLTAKNSGENGHCTSPKPATKDDKKQEVQKTSSNVTQDIKDSKYCKLCDRAFSRPWVLLRHLAGQHVRAFIQETENRIIYLCPFCLEFFPQYFEFKTHVMTHADILFRLFLDKASSLTAEENEKVSSENLEPGFSLAVSVNETCTQEQSEQTKTCAEEQSQQTTKDNVSVNERTYPAEPSASCKTAEQPKTMAETMSVPAEMVVEKKDNDEAVAASDKGSETGFIAGSEPAPAPTSSRKCVRKQPSKKTHSLPKQANSGAQKSSSIKKSKDLTQGGKDKRNKDVSQKEKTGGTRKNDGSQSTKTGEGVDLDKYCRLCQRSFCRNWVFAQHIASQHTHPYTREPNENGFSFSCHLCQQVYPKKGSYMTHIRQHTKFIIQEFNAMEFPQPVSNSDNANTGDQTGKVCENDATSTELVSLKAETDELPGKEPHGISVSKKAPGKMGNERVTDGVRTPSKRNRSSSKSRSRSPVTKSATKKVKTFQQSGNEELESDTGQEDSMKLKTDSTENSAHTVKAQASVNETVATFANNEPEQSMPPKISASESMFSSESTSVDVNMDNEECADINADKSGSDSSFNSPVSSLTGKVTKQQKRIVSRGRNKSDTKSEDALIPKIPTAEKNGDSQQICDHSIEVKLSASEAAFAETSSLTYKAQSTEVIQVSESEKALSSESTGVDVNMENGNCGDVSKPQSKPDNGHSENRFKTAKSPARSGKRKAVTQKKKVSQNSNRISTKNENAPTLKTPVTEESVCGPQIHDHTVKDATSLNANASNEAASSLALEDGKTEPGLSQSVSEKTLGCADSTFEEGKADNKQCNDGVQTTSKRNRNKNRTRGKSLATASTKSVTRKRTTSLQKMTESQENNKTESKTNSEKSLRSEDMEKNDDITAVPDTTVQETTSVKTTESPQQDKHCRLCQRDFCRNWVLAQHISSQHLHPYTVSQTENSFSYLCHLCQEVFSPKAKYMYHITCHTNDIIKNFNSAESLTEVTLGGRTYKITRDASEMGSLSKSPNKAKKGDVTKKEKRKDSTRNSRTKHAGFSNASKKKSLSSPEDKNLSRSVSSQNGSKIQVSSCEIQSSADPSEKTSKQICVESHSDKSKAKLARTDKLKSGIDEDQEETDPRAEKPVQDEARDTRAVKAHKAKSRKSGLNREEICKDYDASSAECRPKETRAEKVKSDLGENDPEASNAKSDQSVSESKQKLMRAEISKTDKKTCDKDKERNSNIFLPDVSHTGAKAEIEEESTTEKTDVDGHEEKREDMIKESDSSVDLNSSERTKEAKCVAVGMDSDRSPVENKKGNRESYDEISATVKTQRSNTEEFETEEIKSDKCEEKNEGTSIEVAWSCSESEIVLTRAQKSKLVKEKSQIGKNKEENIKVDAGTVPDLKELTSVEETSAYSNFVSLSSEEPRSAVEASVDTSTEQIVVKRGQEKLSLSLQCQSGQSSSHPSSIAPVSLQQSSFLASFVNFVSTREPDAPLPLHQSKKCFRSTSGSVSKGSCIRNTADAEHSSVERPVWPPVQSLPHQVDTSAKEPLHAVSERPSAIHSKAVWDSDKIFSEARSNNIEHSNSMTFEEQHSSEMTFEEQLNTERKANSSDRLSDRCIEDAELDVGTSRPLKTPMTKDQRCSGSSANEVEPLELAISSDSTKDCFNVSKTSDFVSNIVASQETSQGVSNVDTLRKESSVLCTVSNVPGQKVLAQTSKDLQPSISVAKRPTESYSMASAVSQCLLGSEQLPKMETPSSSTRNGNTDLSAVQQNTSCHEKTSSLLDIAISRKGTTISSFIDSAIDLALQRDATSSKYLTNCRLPRLLTHPADVSSSTSLTGVTSGHLQEQTAGISSHSEQGSLSRREVAGCSSTAWRYRLPEPVSSVQDSQLSLELLVSGRHTTPSLVHELTPQFELGQSKKGGRGAADTVAMSNPDRGSVTPVDARYDTSVTTDSSKLSTVPESQKPWLGTSDSELSSSNCKNEIKETIIEPKQTEKAESGDVKNSAFLTSTHSEAQHENVVHCKDRSLADQLGSSLLTSEEHCRSMTAVAQKSTYPMLPALSVPEPSEAAGDQQRNLCQTTEVSEITVSKTGGAVVGSKDTDRYRVSSSGDCQPAGQFTTPAVPSTDKRGVLEEQNSVQGQTETPEPVEDVQLCADIAETEEDWELEDDAGEACSHPVDSDSEVQASSSAHKMKDSATVRLVPITDQPASSISARDVLPVHVPRTYVHKREDREEVPSVSFTQDLRDRSDPQKTMHLQESVVDGSHASSSQQNQFSFDTDADTDLPDLCIESDPQRVILSENVVKFLENKTKLPPSSQSDKALEKKPIFSSDKTSAVPQKKNVSNSVEKGNEDVVISAVVGEFEVTVKKLQGNKCSSSKIKKTYCTKVEVKKEEVVEEVKEDSEIEPAEPPTRKPLLGVKPLRSVHQPEPFVWDVDGEEDSTKQARNVRSLRAFQQKVHVSSFSWEAEGSEERRSKADKERWNCETADGADINQDGDAKVFSVITDCGLNGSDVRNSDNRDSKDNGNIQEDTADKKTLSNVCQKNVTEDTESSTGVITRRNKSNLTKAEVDKSESVDGTEESGSADKHALVTRTEKRGRQVTPSRSLRSGSSDETCAKRSRHSASRDREISVLTTQRPFRKSRSCDVEGSHFVPTPSNEDSTSVKSQQKIVGIASETGLNTTVTASRDTSIENKTDKELEGSTSTSVCTESRVSSQPTKQTVQSTLARKSGPRPISVGAKKNVSSAAKPATVSSLQSSRIRKKLTVVSSLNISTRSRLRKRTSRPHTEAEQLAVNEHHAGDKRQTRSSLGQVKNDGKTAASKAASAEGSYSCVQENVGITTACTNSKVLRSRDVTPEKPHQNTVSEQVSGSKAQTSERKRCRSASSNSSQNRSVSREDSSHVKSSMDHISSVVSAAETTVCVDDPAPSSDSKCQPSSLTRSQRSRERKTAQTDAAKQMSKPILPAQPDSVMKTEQLDSETPGSPKASNRTDSAERRSKNTAAQSPESQQNLSAMVRRRGLPSSWHKTVSRPAKKRQIPSSQTPQYEIIRVEPDHRRTRSSDKDTEVSPRTVHTRVSVDVLKPALHNSDSGKTACDQKWSINRHIAPSGVRKRSVDPHYPFSFKRARRKSEAK